jgi:thiol-disulfide isomerase/thioredoxin
MGKKINFLVALCLLSVSLFAQTVEDFEIKFNIKGTNPKGIYVTFFGGKDAASSEQIGANNGEFVFKGKTPVPVVARLSFSGENKFLKMVGKGYIPVKSANLWIIVYPGANFSVEGSLEGKDFIDLYPEDNGENNILAELNKKMMPIMNSQGNLQIEMKINTSLDENQKKELQVRIETYGKEIEVIKRDFLLKHTSSLAAIWLMEDMLIRSEIKPEELIPLLKNVDMKKYGSHYFYRALNDRIDGSLASAVGKQCPGIETDSTPDGTAFNIKSMRGKYVIIDFWGTWCSPCIQGMPHMKAFRDKHKDKIQILGISNDRSADVWKAFIEKSAMNWPNILIGKGDKDFVTKFNVQGFPTKILISPDGKILLRESGEREDFYTKIEDLIK